MKRLLQLPMALIILLGAVSCVQEPYLPDDPCDAGFVDFKNEVQPLLATNCAFSGCHDATSGQDGVRLDTYANIREEVEPFQPNESEIIEAINDDGGDRMPPPPYAPLSADQKALLVTWIEEGAMNLNCQTSCDTLQVLSFSTDIEPIIQNNCVSCHGPNIQEGYLRLDSYSLVGDAIDNNFLLNRIDPNATASIMPPSGAMSECNIVLIKKWNEQGRQP
jgi:uncharacterized membrane protein